MSKKPVEITREQLDSLHTKFNLLQGDRKAYFETYETTKRTNEQQLKELRDINKDARRQLSELQREGRDAAVLGDAPTATASATALTGTTSSTAKIEGQLKAKRQLYNTLRAKTLEKQKELNLLRDHLRDLELEAKKPAVEDSPLTRKIRELETRLDKAMIKFNETQSIKKTYEQIVARLLEERVGFDNQLAALERTVAAKEHDHDELMLLATDAQHAKEVALGELERVRAAARLDKENRAKLKREKEMLAKARAERDMVSRDKERMKAEAAQELTGGAEDVRRSLYEAECSAGAVGQDMELVRAKLDVYELAFKRIKEATGVSDVNEVIQKVTSQEQQQASLKAMTSANVATIEALNASIAELRVRVETAKYSGTGFLTGSRKAIDACEERLAASVQRLERAKENYDRMAKILIGVKAGIGHLTDKLSCVQRGEAADILGDMDALPPPSTTVAEAADETIVDVLTRCEETLAEVLEKIEVFRSDAGASSGSPGRGAAVGDAKESKDDGEDSFARSPSPIAVARPTSTLASSIGSSNGPALLHFAMGISERDVEATRAFNMRIHMTDENGGAEDEGSDNEAGRYGGDDDACETRENVKRAAKLAVSSSRRGGAKKRE